jgi:alpha-L-fucosidase
MIKKLCCSALLLVSVCCFSQTSAPLGPLPDSDQVSWHHLEFYLFVHFGPNTFTDLEWGKGNEQEAVFNPAELDCGQWCRIAKAAGAKGIIITAKHHDGFCLWPSAYSRHTVKESPWRNGRGDVLAELSKSCRESGLLFGVYLSPWDRNHPQYGTPGYNEVFVNMMIEVSRRYGPLFEFWWDGANGEGPNGKKQVYDWGLFERTLRKNAPHTVIFSDIGPDIRWVGNERGKAGDPDWDFLDTAGFARGAGAPPTDTLNHGNVWGKHWIPPECDVSIRPGWFYHSAEDGQVKRPEDLFRLYLESVGRGANLLLNVPPNRKGLISPYDSAALMGFAKLRKQFTHPSLLQGSGVTISTRSHSGDTHTLIDGNEDSFLSLGGDFTQNYVEFVFQKPIAFNCLVLQEPVRMGQRISSFRIEMRTIADSLIVLSGQTIGRKRILVFPGQWLRSMRIRVTGAKGEPLLSECQAFYIRTQLPEPERKLNKS